MHLVVESAENNKMRKLYILPAMVIFLSISFRVYADVNINMKEVRDLAKLPVDEVLEKSLVETFNIENYWGHVHGRKKPLVVFFYSNSDGTSQRLATLIRYIAPIYNNRLSFARVKVVEKGKPDKITAKELESRYSLDKTPGILFYDNVGADMVLEDEDYIDADFKEFRTPRMFLWRTYFSAVRKELDNLLAD